MLCAWFLVFLCWFCRQAAIRCYLYVCVYVVFRACYNMCMVLLIRFADGRQIIRAVCFRFVCSVFFCKVHGFLLGFVDTPQFVELLLFVLAFWITPDNLARRPQQEVSANNLNS